MAPNQDILWKEVIASSADALRRDTQSRLTPKHKAFHLNEAALETILADAPLEFSEAEKVSHKEIMLPTPDGAFARFRFVESPIMEPSRMLKFDGSWRLQ